MQSVLTHRLQTPVCDGSGEPRLLYLVTSLPHAGGSYRSLSIK